MKKLFFLICFCFNLSKAQDTDIISRNGETTATGTSNHVGVTSGELSVSLSGAATYNMPIYTPPGINGVEPQVALSYNSQSGNGMAGYGWHIAGVSMITRIPANKFYDNRVGNVNLDLNDRYALDGQRLLLKDPSQTYGAPDTEYVTENFSNLRIVAKGTHDLGAQYGPSYFEIYYPDGSIAFYGNSINSRSRMDWGITYSLDKRNLRINYQYITSGNTLKISQIDYGNRSPNPSINFVNFTYKNRLKNEVAYINGVAFTNSLILDKIEVKGHSNTLLKIYQLGYNTTQLNYERLNSITESGKNGVGTLNPTIFEYETTNYNDFAQPGSNQMSNLPFGGVDASNTSVISGDFNGTGKAQIAVYRNNQKHKLYFYNDLENQNAIPIEKSIPVFDEIFSGSILQSDYKLYPNTGFISIKGNGYDWPLVTFSGATFEEGTIINQWFYNYNFPSINVPRCPSSFRQCGRNGNETDEIDIKTIYENEENEDILNNNKFIDDQLDYQFSINKNYISGDFNGDGVTDIIAIERNTTYSTFTCDYVNNCYIRNANNTYIGGKIHFVNFNAGIDTPALAVNYAGQILIQNTTQFHTGDFNGDGKTDLYVLQVGNIKVYTLNENNLFVELTNYNHPNIKLDVEKPVDETPTRQFLSTKSVFLLGDYNGDGKTDFLIPQSAAYNSSQVSTWTCFTSKGDISGFVIQNLSSNGTNNSNNPIPFYELPVTGWDGNYNPYVIYNSIPYYIPIDIDNDGKTDIVKALNLTELYREYDDYSQRGRPIRFAWGAFINNSSNQINFSNSQGITTLTNLGIREYPIPIFLNSRNPHKRGFISFLTNNKFLNFKTSKNHRIDVSLRKIRLGNGYEEGINYDILTPPSLSGEVALKTYHKAPSLITYPYITFSANPDVFVVRKLQKRGFETSSYNEQIYKYQGLVARADGLGSQGYMSNLSTNWAEFANQQPIYTINQFDPTRRGALTRSFTKDAISQDSSIPIVPSYNENPTIFIQKSETIYATSISANKVFTIRDISSLQINGLDNTSLNTTKEYDIYGNIQNNTSAYNNHNINQTEKFTESNIEYTHEPNVLTNYFIGRPTKKTESYTNTNGTLTNEENYTYSSNYLLTQVRKKGHNTNEIRENNVYNAFGNITQKSITAHGISRSTNYLYDATNRFVTRTTDPELLQVNYEHDSSTGWLTKEINPYGLTTTYQYDSWGNKTHTIDYLNKTHTLSTQYINNRRGIRRTTLSADGGQSFIDYDDRGNELVSANLDINNNWSRVFYKYDRFGRNTHTSEPSFNLTDSGALWTTTIYDRLGRMSQVNMPTGRVINTAFNGLTASANDGVQTVTTIRNSYNIVVSKQDTGGTILFDYFADDQLKSSTYGSVVVSNEYDGWGRKKKLIDPSAGTYTYNYNDFGELLQETTPNGTTNYVYSNLGKLLRKSTTGTNQVGTNTATTYSYNSDKLLRQIYHRDLQNGFYPMNQFIEYDQYKRVIKTREVTEHINFEKEWTFDTFGRIDTEKVFARDISTNKSATKTIKLEYVNGHSRGIRDNSNNSLLHQINQVNARGQATISTLGNQRIWQKNYDNFGYNIESQLYTTGFPIQQFWLSNDYNVQTGNLNERFSSLFGSGYLQENFQYDNLDRLTHYPSYWNGNTTQVQQNYDPSGRITSNEVGSYQYHAQKYYQNTTINQLSSFINTHYQNFGELNVSYHTDKTPQGIERIKDEQVIESIRYKYNSDGERIFANFSASNRQKFYASDGSAEITRLPNGIVDIILFLGGDAYTAPVVYKSDGTINNNLLYLHRDHLGSIVAISNQTGNIIEKRHFDAWGRLTHYWNNNRQTTLPDGINTFLLLDRGYTGHEHLLSVGLIHMNGRLYDPIVHRFLQPDNFIQDPENTQSYNRYGYVWNNPFKYTDPSGELVWFIWAGIAISAYIAGTQANGGNWNPLKWNWSSPSTYAAIIFGGTLGYISGGLASTITASVTTAVTAKLGTGFLSGFVSGGIGAAVGGAFTGFFNTFLPGGSGDPFQNALIGAASGFVLGGAIKGTIDGVKQVKIGNSFMTGQAPVATTPRSTVISAIDQGSLNNVSKSTSIQPEIKANNLAQPNSTPTSKPVQTNNNVVKATAPKTIGIDGNSIKNLKIDLGNVDDAINMPTSSTSNAPSRTYTIYDGDGNLHKFGVSDADLSRYSQSLSKAGPGATGKFSDIITKAQAHSFEKYMRSLHFNSTGQYNLTGMKIPHPVNFDTGLRIKP